MKEIILLDNNAIKSKLLILDNSISFIEEYYQNSSEQQKSKVDHYNIPIADIHGIKYSHFQETQKSKINNIAFIFTGLLFAATLIFTFEKITAGALFCLIGGFVTLIIGLSSMKPGSSVASQKLIIEGENGKIIYSKNILLTTEKLLEIISVLRGLNVLSDSDISMMNDLKYEEKAESNQI